MGKTLYLECESGISGDMTVAALLDLGADQQVLKKALASLPVQGFDIRISRVKKSGLDACDFDVVLDKEHENHDHDMEYLHGHTHAHNHATEHMHGHDLHNHDAEYIHEHRSFVDILQIIESSSLTERAKKTATDIFSVLADAEAKAHGVPRNQVSFHEVGAVDSIVDILSVAVCLDNLDIDQVIVTELCEGRGTVRCQHGILPIPVPAVTNIVQANHLKLKLTQIEGELVTPTGAAIVAAIRTSDKLPESFFIEKTGLGAGKREYACAGILRAMILESENEKSWMEKDEICKLETNIDDCSGEAAYRLSDKEKRKKFGYVEQSFHMVPGTVRDQITLFDPAIGDEAVQAAAKLVGLHGTIVSLDDGYDTLCKPEIFSQGQWQLLSIARAVAGKPGILLLDEITANLDAETEEVVLRALKSASEGRTVISISHRVYQKDGTGRLITVYG